MAQRNIVTVAESHAHVGDKSRPLLKMVSFLKSSSDFKGLITIAPSLVKYFHSIGVPEEKLCILPDGVDLKLFQRPPEFAHPSNERPTVLYSGHLYDYKGIPKILEAASLAPQYNFELLGGHDGDIERLRQKVNQLQLKNVKVLGRVDHSRVPTYLWNADVLLLPPSGNHPSALWTSPVKLGEYLASGTPVVATEVPALKYWLYNDEVHFTSPDSGAKLVTAIQYVLDHPISTASMVDRAYNLAKSLSYEQRCRSILHFFKDF